MRQTATTQTATTQTATTQTARAAAATRHRLHQMTRASGKATALRPTGSPQPAGSGSVIAVVATDAPLLPHQCKALARRVTLGLARTGTTGSHFSGDLFLAFSTASPGGITPGVTTFRPGAEGRYDQLRFIPWGFLDPFYTAVVQSTEEAVLNALIANEDMTGRAGHRTPAMPHDRVADLLSTRHG